MLNAQSPTAIVWTETEWAYQSSVYDYVLADIRAVKSWIEREVDLAKIRAFGDNWDGFRAAAPDQTVWERASAFLRLLRERDIANPPMRVVLSPNGSIAFEWLEGDSFLRAEIGDSNEVEWMLAIPGQSADFRVESLAPSAAETVQVARSLVLQPSFKSLAPSAAEMVRGQEWKPAPAAAGELAYASAR